MNSSSSPTSKRQGAHVLKTDPDRSLGSHLDEANEQAHKCSMNVQVLIDRRRDGFRPFELRLSDGRAFPVPHPEFIAVSRYAVVVMDRRGIPVHIDPLHIVSVDDKPSGRRTPSSKA
jgi:hypothetical protein